MACEEEDCGCDDLTIDEVEAALAERGIGPARIGRAMAKVKVALRAARICSWCGMKKVHSRLLGYYCPRCMD